MKTIALLLYLVTTLWCQSVLADDLEDFGNQMSYFYLAPSQESFSTLQKNADQFRDKLESAGNGADILVAVMIAKISQKYHWPIGDGTFGKRANEIVQGNSHLAKYVVDDSQVDPTKLDIWWVSFFATGDEHFLENIFQYAGLELPKGDIAGLLIVAAATWSFKSNCRQHKKVMEFARQKLDSPSISEAQVEFVKECIAFAETKGTEQGAAADADTFAILRGRVVSIADGDTLTILVEGQQHRIRLAEIDAPERKHGNPGQRPISISRPGSLSRKTVSDRFH